MNRRFVRSILLAGALASVSGCHVYWGAEIAGRVVDAQTGRAIEGATVAVIWNLYGGVAHGSTLGSLLAEEATTDAEGKFLLRGWGPRFVFWNGLHVSAPTLLVGHPDYYLDFKHHARKPGSIVPPTFSIETRECECGEAEVALYKLDGDLRRFQENAETADRLLPLASPRHGSECAWKDVPKFASGILKRAAVLDARKVSHSLPTRQSLRAYAQCGDEDSLLE